MKRFLIIFFLSFILLAGCAEIDTSLTPDKAKEPQVEEGAVVQPSETEESETDKNESSQVIEEESAPDSDSENTETITSDEDCDDLTVYPVDVNDIHILGGMYGIALPDDVHYKQLYKYYKQCDQYYVLVRRENSNLDLGISNDFDFTGLLILNDDQLNDMKWEKYLKVRDLASSSASPNPHNVAIDFWGGGQGLFLAAVDQMGAGSGEGVMKIFTTKELGKPWWWISKCFYYNPDKICSNGGLQCTAIAGNLDKFDEYDFNSDAGQFELTQFNKATGKMETIPIYDCRNAGTEEYVQ